MIAVLAILVILSGIVLWIISLIPQWEFIRWEKSFGRNDRALVARSYGWFFWKERFCGIVYGSHTVWHWEDTGRRLGTLDEWWMSEHWSLKEHWQKKETTK